MAEKRDRLGSPTVDPEHEARMDCVGGESREHVANSAAAFAKPVTGIVRRQPGPTDDQGRL